MNRNAKGTSNRQSVAPSRPPWRAAHAGRAPADSAVEAVVRPGFNRMFRPAPASRNVPQMRIQPLPTMDYFGIPGELDDERVLPHLIPRMRRMVQMTPDPGATKIQPTNPGVEETLGEFIVFAPPADEFLVESVDAANVVHPRGEVAAADALQVRNRRQEMRNERETDEMPAAFDATRENTGPIAFFSEGAAGGVFVQQDAFSLNEEAGPRDSPVVADEMRVKDEVAVDEHHIVAGHAREGAVAHSCGAETVMLAPFVDDVHAAAPCVVDDARGLGAGTVVADDDLVRADRLSGNGTEHSGESVGPFVGGDYECEFHYVYCIVPQRKIK